MENEINLIQQAARGDMAAFESLFQAHFRPVYSYALNLSGDPALAEDLTQDTFIRAHRSLSRFGSPWNFRPWLFQITRNLLQDHIRRGHDVPMVDEAGAAWPDPQPGPEQTMLSAERGARIRNALGRLPEHHREALILRELEGLSYDDIAATMGVSTQYVRVLIHRARAKFQENYALRLLAEEPLSGCNVLLERLDALHDGEPFSEADERFIRKHLSSCSTCQQRKRELAALSTLLGAALPVPVPAALEGRTLNHVQAAQRWRHFGTRAIVFGGLGVGALVLTLLSWMAWRALAAPANPTPATVVATATLTPPSTSNVQFQTPTLQPTLPPALLAIATETLVSTPVLPPDTPPAPPTWTFTPVPPTPIPDTDGPDITKFNHNPASIFTSGPGSCSTVTTMITATITDPSGIQSAVVIFAHTDFGSVPMSNAGGSIWRASLGPFSAVGDGTVDYQIRAFDNFNNRSDTGFKAVTILACLK
jgi:RNA polymerase sigma-70 factor (ECF subfamily)